MGEEPIRSLFSDDPDMQELIEEYVAELPVFCAKLQTAADAGDFPNLERMGHQLKGSGGGYGFPQLSDAGAALESAAKRASSDPDALRRCIEEIVRLCRCIQAAG